MREIDLDDVSGRITAVSYGDLRSGKTRFAATWPRPVFLSDTTESGWTTIATMGSDSWYEPSVRPKVYAIEKVVDMADVLNNRVIPGIQSGQFKTIVIDSLTFYGDLFFAAILASQGNKPDTRKAYGDLGSHLRDLRVKVHTLNINVVWLCLAKQPETESPTGQPMIPGQQSIKFPAGCDFIFYHRSFQEGANLKFEMRTRKYGAYIAGGRDSGILPDPIVDPTYRRVHELLQAGRVSEGGIIVGDDVGPSIVMPLATPTLVKPTVARPTVVRGPMVRPTPPVRR